MRRRMNPRKTLTKYNTKIKEKVTDAHTVLRRRFMPRAAMDIGRHCAGIDPCDELEVASVSSRWCGRKPLDFFALDETRGERE